MGGRTARRAFGTGDRPWGRPRSRRAWARAPPRPSPGRDRPGTDPGTPPAGDEAALVFPVVPAPQIAHRVLVQMTSDTISNPIRTRPAATCARAGPGARRSHVETRDELEAADQSARPSPAMVVCGGRCRDGTDPRPAVVARMAVGEIEYTPQGGSVASRAWAFAVEKPGDRRRVERVADRIRWRRVARAGRAGRTSRPRRVPRARRRDRPGGPAGLRWRRRDPRAGPEGRHRA